MTSLVLSIWNGSSSYLQIRSTTIKAWMYLNFVKIPSSADQRGDRGSGPPPPPPGKLQVIWVSIGNKQFDPLEKFGPPWKMLDPLWNLENDGFL